MPQQLPGLYTTKGEPVAVFNTAGQIVAGGTPTTGGDGVRDTTVPRPVAYNPDALTGVGTESITYTTGTTSLDGGVPVPWASPQITMLGIIPADAKATSAVQTVGPFGSATYAASVVYTGRRLGIRLTGQPANGMIRLKVDGKFYPTQKITAPAASSVVVVEFPDARERSIRIDLRYFGFAGIDFESTAVLKPGARPETRVLVIGDSYVQGWNYDAPAGGGDIIDPFAWSIGDLLGVEVFYHGFGGTGYINRYPDSHYGSVNRKAVHEKVRPDYTIVFGSQNDGNVSDPATMLASAKDLYLDLARYCRTFVVGPSPYGTTAAEDVLRQAVAASPRIIGEVYPLSAKWFPGGTEDGVHHWSAHPTYEGNHEYARRIAAAFTTALHTKYPETA